MFTITHSNDIQMRQHSVRGGRMCRWTMVMAVLVAQLWTPSAASCRTLTTNGGVAIADLSPTRGCRTCFDNDERQVHIIVQRGSANGRVTINVKSQVDQSLVLVLVSPSVNLQWSIVVPVGVKIDTVALFSPVELEVTVSSPLGRHTEVQWIRTFQGSSRMPADASILKDVLNTLKSKFKIGYVTSLSLASITQRWSLDISRPCSRTTANPGSTSAPPKAGGSGLSIAPIIGGVIAVVILLILGLIVGLCCFCKSQRRKPAAASRAAPPSAIMLSGVPPSTSHSQVAPQQTPPPFAPYPEPPPSYDESVPNVQAPPRSAKGSLEPTAPPVGL